MASLHGEPSAMIYKFKSNAAGDVIMLGAHGDALLKLLGKDVSASGIIEPAQMPAAIAALEQAVHADEAERARAEAEAQAEGHTLPPRQEVSLRQRVWPLVEMMKRSAAEDQAIVWGV
jgi:hypothetical protein